MTICILGTDIVWESMSLVSSHVLILSKSVTEIETIVEPNSVTNDVWRESVSRIGIHVPDYLISAS